MAFAFRSVLPVLLLLASAGLMGCPVDCEENPSECDRPSTFPSVDRAAVTGGGVVASDDVRVDVYLDATTSMEGYVGSGTEYAEFLRSLEEQLITTWGESDVAFYRFGTRVDSVGREGFLSARTDLPFYRAPNVFRETRIDSVLARTDEDRLAVVVTDLFQDAGDTNALVSQIKERVFGRGLTLAVIAVESAFDGTVYDAPGGPYRYASDPADPSSGRPFYALVMGAPAQVDRMLTTLEGTRGVRRDRVLVVTPFVVEDYRLDLTKQGVPTDEARGVNIGAVDGDTYRLVVRDDYDGGRLRGTLALTSRDDVAGVAPDRVELVAYRKGSGEADSSRTEDIELADVAANDEGLAFDVEIDVDGPPGDYAYLLQFQVGDVGGQALPGWVNDLSTEAPTADADPNRTLNLERLLGALVQAAATERRPLLAQAAVTLDKQ